MLGFLIKNETVERRAQESVVRALEWLVNQKVSLGYTPTVAYVDTTHPQNKKIAASIDLEEESFLRALNMPLSMFCEALYVRSGLAGNSQNVSKILELNREYFPVMIPKSDADITLYKPAKSNIGKLDEIMVHEIWHLIEKEKGLLNGDNFIHEGTATHVQNRFAGRSSYVGNFFWKIFDNDLQARMYFGVAEAISLLYGEKFDLRELFKNSNREKIRRLSESNILTPLKEKIKKQLEANYQKLYQQSQQDRYQVVYEGAFKQAVNRGQPNTELPFPFVIAVSQSDSFKGRIYDAGGVANFEGTISAKQVEFVKRYSNRGVNSNPIKYTGRSLQKGIYAGEWIFNSSSATSETSGKFIMTEVVK